MPASQFCFRRNAPSTRSAPHSNQELVRAGKAVCQSTDGPVRTMPDLISGPSSSFALLLREEG